MPLQTRATGAVCYNAGPGEDDEDLGDEEEAEILLTDKKTGRTLNVGVEHAVEHEGETYVVCYPIDEAVAFAKMGKDDLLEGIENEKLIDALFPNAQAVLAEDHIVLNRSAYVMTVDDQGEDVDDEEEEDEQGGMGGMESENEVEILGEFACNGGSYFVVRPVEPVLLVARERNGELEVLQGADLERVSPYIEDYIENLTS